MMTHELEKIMSLIEERLCIIWYPTENRDTFASELAAILSRTPSHGRVSDEVSCVSPSGPGLRGFAPEPAAQSQPKALVPDVDRFRAALEKIAEKDGDGFAMLTPQAMQHVACAALGRQG